MNARTVCTAIATATAVTTLLVASPAWAAPSTQVVQGDVLRLVSIADWGAASSMLPGQPMQWDVIVSADAADPGLVTVGISAHGDAELVADALTCAQAWIESGCPGGATVLKSGWAIPRDGVEVQLVEMVDTEVVHLRFVIALVGDAVGSTGVRVHAAGAGESAVIGSDGGLATTGLSPFTPWTLGGGIALVGVGLALGAGRHRPRVPAESEGGS